MSRILSTGGGGCLPQCMLGYTSLGADTPPGADTPWEQTHTPWNRHTHPPGADTPSRSRHPLGADTPWEQTPPRSRHPPGSRHPPHRNQTAAYGQRAASTHPTGMHSCIIIRISCFEIYFASQIRLTKTFLNGRGKCIHFV